MSIQRATTARRSAIPCSAQRLIVSITALAPRINRREMKAGAISAPEREEFIIFTVSKINDYDTRWHTLRGANYMQSSADPAGDTICVESPRRPTIISYLHNFY